MSSYIQNLIKQNNLDGLKKCSPHQLDMGCSTFNANALFWAIYLNATDDVLYYLASVCDHNHKNICGLTIIEDAVIKDNDYYFNRLVGAGLSPKTDCYDYSSQEARQTAQEVWDRLYKKSQWSKYHQELSYIPVYGSEYNNAKKSFNKD